jgi:hypothetical protein
LVFGLLHVWWWHEAVRYVDDDLVRPFLQHRVADRMWSFSGP